VGEWFDPAGADPATVRDAFRLLWQELRRHWVAEHRIGAVARIDPAGQITQYRVPGDSLPSGVLEAPDGALWYIAVDQIKRIDPAGHVQGWTAGGGKGAADLGYPSAMTVGPDGAIWYDLTGSPAAVRRFDPLRGPSTVAELPEGVAPRSLVTGPDGAVWFCEHDDRDNADGIGRVTAQGHYTSRPLPPDAHPWTLAVGPDGAIWFSEAGGIGRVTTAGEVTHFPVARTEHPTSLISGPQGALWFTTETGVGRLTPAGAVTLWPVPEAESLAAIAAGPKGDLWVADSQASVLRRFRPPN
jgi:virginiamycin B lyase